jgi:hypothetical protein
VFITVIAFDKFYGSKPLEIEKIIKLVKEPNNKYDTEAIACEMRHFGKIGYVANSVNSVIRGCMSSGRVYDKIEDGYFAKIKFYTGNMAIAKILTSDEFIEEIENPESDVHYLSESN